MPLRRKNRNYYIFLCLVVIVTSICPDASGTKPILIPIAEELVIEEGSELRIECHSEQTRLHFSFPEYTFMSPRSSHEILPPGNENGTWTFLRRKTVSLDTGWYACAAENVEIENHFKNLNHTQENIAWIYVYVSSSEPFADRYYTFPKTIIILAGSPSIVPCRPTSPNLVVQLWKNFRIVDSNDQKWFDPRIGFIVESPSRKKLEDIFHCRINGILDEYFLFYSSVTGQKPKINATSDELVLQSGEELRIECHGEAENQFNVLSFLSFGGLNSSYNSSTFEILLGEKGKTTFLRRKIVPGDTGWYGCAQEGVDLRILPFYIEYTRKEIDWIYVYVESNTFQLVPMSVDLMLTARSANIVIHCRPTSPSFNVSLTSKIPILNENVRFHPRLGFIVRRGPDQDYFCYECVSRRDDPQVSKESCFTYGESLWLFMKHSLFISSEKFILLVGEDATLTCSGFGLETFFLEWNTPTRVPKNRILLDETPHIMFSYMAFWDLSITLEIKNVTENDADEYSCAYRSFEHEEKISSNIDIYDRRRINYIKFDDSDRVRTFVGLLGQSAICMLEYKPFHLSNIDCFNPLNTSILMAISLASDKYSLRNRDEDRVVFEIYNLTFEDAGLYTVIETESLSRIQVTLNVQVLPTVSMENRSKPYFTAPGESFNINSEISGLPRPNITWTFTGYPNFPSDEDRNRIIYLDHKEVFVNNYTWFSNTTMSTNISGILTCIACNILNCSRNSKRILMSDGIGHFRIIGPTEKVYIGDNVSLTCAGSIYEFKNLSWDDEFDECFETVNRNSFDIKQIRTRYSIQRVLHMKNVQQWHRRSFTCSGQTIAGHNESSVYYLNLSIPEKPSILLNNSNQTTIVFDPRKDDLKIRNLSCCARGDPTPTIAWRNDESQLKESLKYEISSETCIVVQLDLRKEKPGRYTCRAENRFGLAEDHVDFLIVEGANDRLLLAVITKIIFIIIVVASAWLIIRKRRAEISKLQRKKDIMKRFDGGALDYLDPNLDVADQAEILPYDENWEYPRNMLQFGKILGSGAFGIVRKAEAKSICPGEPVTTVAVKMVRATSTLHQMVALSRELKVLVHLGQHQNIVNLLGACTKNISFGELFVIVEFCRFGNMKDYLTRRRAGFIDQVDHITGEITVSDLSMHNVSLTEDSANDDWSVSMTEGSCYTEDTSGTESKEVACEVSVEPRLRSKYEGDYTDATLKPIRTKDLLCWTWQVSRGMRYLGVRKIVHGDLAARNILLADNNVIKICDFGLAKALYNDDHYNKEGGDPLPVKWMSIEALEHLRFSIESDVWSFGVVLWEFFTLAESPYPEIHPKYLYQKLLTGYRMDKPKYAPKNIYRIMMNCWEAEPVKRPSFELIETLIHELLDDSVKGYYLDSSNQYCSYIKSGKKDYLTMNPSRNEAVSFSVEQEKIKLGNLVPDESDPKPSGLDSSETIN